MDPSDIFLGGVLSGNNSRCLLGLLPATDALRRSGFGSSSFLPAGTPSDKERWFAIGNPMAAENS